MSDASVPLCITCGQLEYECTCSDGFVQHFIFEGGPLDGCSLKIPDDRFISDVFIGVPVQMRGDDESSSTGESVHQYTNCNSWQLEGSKDVTHYMGHVAVRNVALSVINKVFQGSQKVTPENQQWIDDLNKALERVEEKETLSFDANNDDESDEEREEDGEGWKNK